MKSINLILSMLAIGLLSMTFVSCNDDESGGGAELSALSYVTGEISLGNANYVSAKPSLFATSTTTFAITKITQNGKVIENASPEIMTIDEASGVITAKIKSDLSYAGEYLVSVRVKTNAASADYADVFRLVVKAIVFDSDPEIERGTAAEISAKEIHFAQPSGTLFFLNQPYDGITLDSLTCKISVAATVEAGIYPISIRVENKTNSSYVFKNALQILVKSKPYDLVYDPASVTLITKEGHTSATPTVKAASKETGAAVVYSLTSNPSNQFAIDAATGVISLPKNNTFTGPKQTIKLSVKATNSVGSTTFADAYTVVIDPDKKIDPITEVTYADAFPVKLNPGEPWVSSTPTIKGSSIGVVYLIASAPNGVTIDAETGVITMTAGHSMPLLVKDNKLTISVKNSGMTNGYESQLGDFEVDPVMWKVEFVKNENDQIANSGITNMDRYSFMGQMFADGKVQLKNGWGKSSSGDYIDAIGVKTDAATAAKVTNQNNDWIVSAAIAIPEYSLNPSINFDLAHQYGSSKMNIVELYVIEINASNVYTKGEQEQSGTIDSAPSSLTWTKLDTNLEFSTKLGDNPKFKAFKYAVDAYKGKTIRFAFRYYNPELNNNNNTRTTRIDNLRVEDSLNN